MQARPSSFPATSSIPAHVTKEELHQVQAKLNPTMRAPSRELADLKAWINDAHADVQRSVAIDKASVDDGLKENRRERGGLRRYLTQVDDFLKARFSTSEDNPFIDNRPSALSCYKWRDPTAEEKRRYYQAQKSSRQL